MKSLLLTPGPIEIPPFVLEALSQPIIHHRTVEFETILKSVRTQMKSLFGCAQDVAIFASSGTGAMEAAVTNCLSTEDRALIVVGGKFGERWVNLCNAYQIPYDTIHVEWGRAVSVKDIHQKMNHRFYSAVLVQSCETSTGVYHPIHEIAALTKNTETLLMVDAVSSLGAIPMPQDAWGIDVLIGASHKALMLPPGLSFLGLSAQAIAKMKNTTTPKFYFNILKELEALETNQSAFTPAISLIIGLGAVLTHIQTVGLDRWHANTQKLARATRAAIVKMGLSIYAIQPCDNLTAITLPNGIDGEKVKTALSKIHHIEVAGGQDQLKGKIIRVAHMGAITREHMQQFLTAFGATLNGMGYKTDTAEALQLFSEEMA